MKHFNSILVAFIIIFYTSNLLSQWVRTNFPSSAGNVYALEFKGANIFAGSYNTIYFSSDNGLSWEQRGNGINYGWIRTIASNEDNIFAGTMFGGVYKSTNEGLAWTQVYYANYYENVNTLYTTGNSIFLGSVFTNPYLTPTGGVHRSTDEGGTWVELNTGLPVRADVTAFTVNGNYLFTQCYTEGPYRSSDNGANWELVVNGLPLYIARTVRLISSGTKVFTGTNEYGVYRTTNDGSNWVAVNNGLPASATIGALAVVGDNVFAGTSDSPGWTPQVIYLSTNNGENWTSINEGLPQYTNVKAIAIKNSLIFIGIAHDGGYKLGGVWYRPLSELLTDFEGEVSEGYKLEQNYPNPFNPTTTISFSILQSQNLELKVFDVLGNEVATLINEYKQAGEHKIEFNAKNLTSGIYFYQLKTGEFIQTKKMVLMK